VALTLDRRISLAYGASLLSVYMNLSLEERNTVFCVDENEVQID
jgi:hypothetical protein